FEILEQSEQERVEVDDAQNAGSNMDDEKVQELNQKTSNKGNERNRKIEEVSSQASQES
ncbi:hypothetical protein HAX54_037728, partial [Datura stramonium]|nr:hypothetical protein [Datura stramonium]